MSNIIVAVLIAIFAVPAHSQESTPGDFLIAPGLFYSSGLRSRSSNDERIDLRADLRIAYQISPGVFLGPIYAHAQESTKTSGYSSPSLNNTAKSQRQSIGLTLGHVTTSYHFFLSYYPNSTWTLNTTTSSGNGKYVYRGSGVQVDAAYKIPMWGLFFGPQISYKALNYSKLSTDGGSFESISPELKETGLEPSIVMHWFF